LQDIFRGLVLQFNLNFKTTYQPKLNNKLEFDIFIPELSLSFEYNGEQHYQPVSIFHDSLQKRQSRDQFKSKFCEDNGITLIIVPYWWDHSISSLAQTIRLARPDISIPAISVSKPIPQKYMKSFIKNYVSNSAESLPSVAINGNV